MPNAKIAEETKVLSIRFPEAIIKRLDRYVKRFQKEFPGISFQRTDAIRLFVERGLKDPIAPGYQPPEPPKPKVKKEIIGRRLAYRKIDLATSKTRKNR